MPRTNEGEGVSGFRYVGAPLVLASTVRKYFISYLINGVLFVLCKIRLFLFAQFFSYKI